MNIPEIELRCLRYFLASAENGSFRKAAIVLNVQESSISRRIRDLEDKLGTSLFHRCSTGVRLTYAGHIFLASVRRAFHSLEDGVNEIKTISTAMAGRVRIGIFSSISNGFLEQLLREFGREHPTVGIDLVNAEPAVHVAAIRQLSLDVAFLTGACDWQDCESVPLWTERVYIVMPNTHHLSTCSEVFWQDIASEDFIVSQEAPGREIRDFLLRNLSDLGYSPKIQPHLVGRDNLLALVALGRGLTMTSEATIATRIKNVVYRPVVGEVLPFSAVWSPINDNPALRRLLSIARARSKLFSHSTIE
ncbi:LysR family transcriptional regulator [Roseovarius pacificus]|uniref:LysR family transcriptional regulator n=1 Tax=Roseovarius pacificus TaxID=337701 RepID=UPI002A18C566|nr:LysR family transcriptional regulator [Roseovarius pacificus]